MNDFRHGIGQAACAHIVNRENRIALAQGGAAINHLLSAALHFRVAALHRGEVQILLRTARRHAGRRAATQANQHRWPAENHNRRSRRQFRLMDMRFTDIAQSARDHDRLVIAAPLTVGTVLLETAEITGQIRAAKFVVERRRAQRPFNHDRQRRRDPIRLAVIRLLPRLDETGNPQIGNRKAAQSGLGLGPAPGRALIANFTARSSGRAGKRRDRGRMIMRLHFHQDMHRFRVKAVLTISGIREETPGWKAGHHRRIVVIGRQHIIRVALMGMANHGEQRTILFHPVHDPVRVENLVAAMLGIGLREHHQFHIAGIAFQAGEAVQQIVYFVIRQRQTEFAIGDDQRFTPTIKHIYRCQRCGFGLGE